jgi:hypothetical protein
MKASLILCDFDVKEDVKGNWSTVDLLGV